MITLAGALALLVVAAPLLVTAHFSDRAVAGGELGGRLPLILAGVAVGAFVVQNLVGVIAQLAS